MPRPRDPKLYDEIKTRIRKQLEQNQKPWSAYASGRLVKTYKREYAKRNPNKNPYIGKKPSKLQKGLKRWFAENWISDTGHYKYTSKNSVYRPSKRVTPDTPITFDELSTKQLKKAKRIKKTKGRVKKFNVWQPGCSENPGAAKTPPKKKPSYFTRYHKQWRCPVIQLDFFWLPW